MKPWIERPKEEAYLLNPAFCCAALTSSVVGYSSQRPQGMSFPLVFIVLPIVLHKPTREALPHNTRTSLPAWLNENPSARVGFHEHTVALVPFVKDALLFGMLHDWLVLGDDGSIRARLTESGIQSIKRKTADETRECIMRAQFVGKWFAAAGSPQVVMALWGVQP